MMGYLHIENLHKHPHFLECYALEKIEGTSAHILFKNGEIILFSGGANPSLFSNLFDKKELLKKFEETFSDMRNEQGELPEVCFYGEAFGSKIQGMSKYYGIKLRFIVFDVKITNRWKNVPYAEELTKKMGLDFVPYERGPINLDWLNEQRDRPSLVAIIEDAPREGVVIRQIYENEFANGGRIIYKHKRPEFRETKSNREVTQEELQVLTDAKEISDEWVTERRLQHVLDKCPYNGPEDTGKVIKAMVEDIKRESEGEVEWSKAVEKAISKATSQLIHNPAVARQ